MKKEIEKFIKKHTGKCEVCNKKFLAWELNWDGAYVLHLCRSCNLVKKQREENEFKIKLKNAQENGEEFLTSRGEIRGWFIGDEFYRNNHYNYQYDNIDDEIRRNKKMGINHMWHSLEQWDKLFDLMIAFGVFNVNDFKTKRITYMGITHELNPKTERSTAQ